MVAEPRAEPYKYLPSTWPYRVLPDALRELKTFSFWCVPGAKNLKQPGYQNGSEWGFHEWEKARNLQWISDAVRLARDLKVNIGMVVPDGWAVADFDHCRDPDSGFIYQTVQRIIKRLNSPVLISSSGTGLHVILRYTPDQPLPNKSKFTNLDLYLDNFKNQKQGELKKPGTFVAINWHALPGYNALEKPVQLFPDWLEAELFVNGSRVPVADATRPAEPTTVSPTQGAIRPTHEKKPVSNQFLGINPAPDYRSYINGLLTWRKPPGMEDTSHSVWNWYLLRAYFLGDKNPTFEGAVELSKKYETRFERTAPLQFRKSHIRKHPQWHYQEVIKAADYVRDNERIVFTKAGPDYLATPFEQQAAGFVEHLVADRSLPDLAVRLVATIVAQAHGHSEVVITDSQMAALLERSERSVLRAKTNLSAHRCISYNRSQVGTTYKLQFTIPCPGASG